MMTENRAMSAMALLQLAFNRKHQEKLKKDSANDDGSLIAEPVLPNRSQGRNKKCRCGSNIKYKKCCQKKMKGIS